jgi:cytosine/adenosine deaminase-related metal-dependent hydrolase
MQEVEWVGADVWFAHAVYVNPQEVLLLGQHGCGVAHCPSSNMRLASGIAPIREYLRNNVKVGLGVDGSASNDGSHLLAEARQAMLLARLRSGLEGASLSGTGNAWIMTARQALELGTRGGAAVLGRPDLGSLEPGKCADLIAFDLNRLAYAGALHDPLAALVFCAPQRVDWNIVHGHPVVQEGQLLTVDVPALVERHNQAAGRLLAGG